MSDDLKRIKGDLATLKAAYVEAGGKLGATDNHNSCPFCGDTTGFQFTVDDSRGNAWWRCWPGKSTDCAGKGGTIIDLLMRARKLSSQDACKLALDKYGNASGQPAESKAKKPPKRYPMALAAIEALEWGAKNDKRGPGVLGPIWKYLDERGEPILQAIRFNYPGGKKDVFPIWRDGNAWITRGIPSKDLPLYRLPELLKAGGAPGAVLHVAEGEKKADALAALGYTATCSQGGSNKAHASDWKPAARFSRVLVWQDADEPGGKYGLAVAELLRAAAETMPAIVLIDLRPYGLKDGQDVFDVIQSLKDDGKSDDEIRATLETLVEKFGRAWVKRVEFGYPNQPVPFKRNDENGQRSEILNYRLIEKRLKNGDSEEVKKVPVALAMDEIRAQIVKSTNGWPARIKAPGARSPVMFVDEDGAENPRWLPNAENFAAWLQEIATRRFNPKQDPFGANYCTVGETYHSFGGAQGVTEFVAVETRPHWPLMTRENGFSGNHYYTWRAPAEYAPDGRKLAELLKFFDNGKDDNSRALIAALFLTPFAGLPYGKRPAFIITAPDRQCGKTTLATTAAKLAGGAMALDLTPRGLEEYTQRRLSPDGRTKRVTLLDNVTGTLKSGKLDGLVTEEISSGKQLYTGEASQPNTMTFIITANGVRCSRDIALRSFFIDLKRPAYRGDWQRSLYRYLVDNEAFIVADCIHILQSGKDSSQAKKIHDNWPLWCEDVLVPACTHPALRAYVGSADIAAVLRANDEIRQECDDDREEADLFMSGILELIASGRNARGELQLDRENLCGLDEMAGGFYVKDPTRAAFIPSEEMRQIWEKIFGKKLAARQILHIIREHREAGRIDGVHEKHTKVGNGYEVTREALQRYVDDVRKARAAEQQGAALCGG